MLETRVRRALSFIGFVLAVAAFLSVYQTPDTSTRVPASGTPTQETSSEKTTVAAPSSSSTVSVAWPEAVSSTARVMHVVDGDTVDVLVDGETKVTRIRLLGINTPESVDPRKPVQCFGKEASKQVKTWIEGKRVALVEDAQADDHDKYGRLLRILVLEDKTDVNATLVAQGYAHAYVDFPMKKARKAQLRTLEREAQAGERGLWNPSTCHGEAYPTQAP